MAAPTGNKYWEHRDKHGRDYEYTPEKLWEEALKYFKWNEENPLIELVFIQKGITIIDEQGEDKTVHEYPIPKMRAMSLKAFQLYADISHTTWDNYKKNKDFIAICTRIKEIIYSQKFEGASASLLNPSIIARDLGLSDKSQVETIGKSEKVVIKFKKK